MDLSTRWDFDKADHRRRAWSEIENADPEYLIMSPRCTPFSQILSLRPEFFETPEYHELLNCCMVHLQFCVKLMHRQLDRGKKFLFEHPWTAWSWYLEALTSVMKREGVVLAKGDQCPYGQTSTDSDGFEGLVKKTTGWLTNCLCVAARVSEVCENWKLVAEEKHSHVTLMSGRPKGCERYPRALVWAILKGIREGLLMQRRVCSLEVGYHIDEPEALDEFSEMAEFDPIFDRVSGAELDRGLVDKARREEMDYMTHLAVFKRVPVQECWTATNAGPIPVDWVDINTGDDQAPCYRSRLVV